MGTGSPTESQRNHAGHGGQRGHHDGAQAALAGVDHGLFGVEAFAAELLIGVEQENAVLGDDADHHDEAHERGDIERGAGDEQREEDAGDGEQRRREHGDGRGEAAEFEEEHHEDKDDGEGEDDNQILERLLLLFVLAAIITRMGGDVQIGHGLLDAVHAFAKGDVFEAGGDGDVALQVFAADFGLAGNFEKVARIAEAGRLCRCC